MLWTLEKAITIFPVHSQSRDATNIAEPPAEVRGSTPFHLHPSQNSISHSGFRWKPRSAVSKVPKSADAISFMTVFHQMINKKKRVNQFEMSKIPISKSIFFIRELPSLTCHIKHWATLSRRDSKDTHSTPHTSLTYTITHVPLKSPQKLSSTSSSHLQVKYKEIKHTHHTAFRMGYRSKTKYISQHSTKLGAILRTSVY